MDRGTGRCTPDCVTGIPHPPSGTASIDFEVYSEAGFFIDETGKWKATVKGRPGLSAVGAYNYAVDESTRVLSLAYDLHDGGGIRIWFPGLPDPEDLLEHVCVGLAVEAHNSIFEYWIWNKVMTDWPPLCLGQMTCTMSRCAASGLPQGLGNVHHAVELPTVKQDIGKALIKEFCVPHNRKKKKYTKGQLHEYCIHDVATEDGLSARIPRLNKMESRIWLMDQRINDRGVQIDVDAARALAFRIDTYVRQAGGELAMLTGGHIDSPRQATRIGEWLEKRGLHVERTPKGQYKLDKEAVEDLLIQTEEGSTEYNVLSLRQQYSLASVDKIKTLCHMVGPDGRLRGLFRYHGAHTGRWTSTGVQLQNLPRGGMTPEDVARTLDEIKSNNWSSVDGPSPLATISSLVRGLFIAAPGHELVCSDFSAIEGRGQAVLSGEQWRIDVFKTHGKIYEATAADITGIPFDDILAYKQLYDKHHDVRALGKVAELACFTRDTQVLTTRGYVHIVDVTQDDRLWDGVEWVNHGGVIWRGQKKVLNLDGVLVTPDHPVNMKDFWIPARELASNKNILTQALARGSESLPSCLSKEGIKIDTHAAHAHAEMKVGTTYRIYETESQRGALSAVEKKVRKPTLRSILNTLKSCLKLSTGDDYAIGYLRQLADAITKMTECIKITAGEVFKFVRSGEIQKGHSLNTSAHSKDGTLLNWNLTEPMSMGTMSPETSDSYRDGKTCLTKEKCRISKEESQSLRNVYDIALVGPRNRFTIKTDSGHLLVHNSGYQGWIKAWLRFGAGKYLKTEDELKNAILRWRDKSPMIPEMWGGQVRKHPRRWEWRAELYGIEGVVVQALMAPDTWFSYRSISFCHDTRNDVLLCRLPSGRCLWYRQPRLEKKFNRFAEMMVWRITYRAWSSGNGWHVKDSFGGRFFENIVQAYCRDIMACAMLRLEDAGYPIVIHVHDEPVMEVPRGFGSLAEVTELMEVRESWYEDCPVVAGGEWRGPRFRK